MSQELWVINGRSPVLWTFPVLVTWHDDMADLMAAIPLMATHREAMATRLHLDGVKTPEGWRIKRELLEKFGHQTPGGDPEIYFSWSLPRKADDPQYQPEKRRDRDEFLDALYLAGVGRSRDELEYYWNQFCKHALDWLLNKEKPVDMYFLTLHPTPYRANWMHALASRFPRLARTALNKTGVDRETQLIKEGFMDELLSLDLLAYNHKDGYCYRRAEVEYKSTWWKAVRNVERTRMVRQNVFGYAAGVTDAVKRGLEATIRLYGSYLAQISRASVKHVEGDEFGSFRFVPNIPFGRTRPVGPRFGALPPVLPYKFPAFKPAREPEALLAPDERMPEVSPLRPPPQDLRNGRPDLHRSRDQQPPPDRVPVLPPPQKLVSG